MTTEKNLFPPEVLALFDFPGYLAHYEKNCRETSARKAFEKTESLFERYFQRNKFTSYESFKSQKSRYLKNKV